MVLRHSGRSEQRERSGGGALLRRPERSEGTRPRRDPLTWFRAAEAAVSDNITRQRDVGTGF